MFKVIVPEPGLNNPWLRKEDLYVPEVIYRHPKDQVEFVKNIQPYGQGLEILTGSPYIVQAFRSKDNVKFFIGKNDGSMEEVTEDLNRIFTELAKPLRDIMNIHVEKD